MGPQLKWITKSMQCLCLSRFDRSYHIENFRWLLFQFIMITTFSENLAFDLEVTGIQTFKTHLHIWYRFENLKWLLNLLHSQDFHKTWPLIFNLWFEITEIQFYLRFFAIVPMVSFSKILNCLILAFTNVGVHTAWTPTHRLWLRQHLISFKVK